MSGLENPSTGLQRSRRNLIRIGAIMASAIIAKIKLATADVFAGMISIETETETGAETGTGTKTNTGTEIFIVF